MWNKSNIEFSMVLKHTLQTVSNKVNHPNHGKPLI